MPTILSYEEWLTPDRRERARRLALASFQGDIYKISRQEMQSAWWKVEWSLKDPGVWGSAAEAMGKAYDRFYKACRDLRHPALAMHPHIDFDLDSEASEALLATSSCYNQPEWRAERLLSDWYTKYRASIQSLFPMPRQVAAELIRDAITPSTPTMGAWFGWNQPENNDRVLLGHCYGHVRSDEWLSLRDILIGTDIGYEEAKRIVELAGEAGFRIDDDIGPYLGKAILVCDEVHFPFADLDLEDQALYRLHVLMVNTMTDGHNWAVEWGEYMASTYAETIKAGVEVSDWSPHDGDATTLELLDLLLPSNTNLPIKVWDDVSFSRLEGSADTIDWIVENDVAMDLFGLSSIWSDLDEVLAWAIDWLIDEWRDGELKLALTEDMPKPVRNFLSIVESQEVMQL